MVLLHFISSSLSLKYITESPKWLINQVKINEYIDEFNSISYVNNILNEYNEFMKKEKNKLKRCN